MDAPRGRRRLLDFYGLQALAARRLVTDGEVFAVFVHADDELRLRMLDGEQVNGAYHTELAYGSRVVAGIEFDQNGKRARHSRVEATAGASGRDHAGIHPDSDRRRVSDF